MVYTENGTYTAVRRRAPHHCTPSTTEALTLPNRGVLSAAPCIIQKNTEDILPPHVVGPEVNVDRTNRMFRSCGQNALRNRNVKIPNVFFGKAVKFVVFFFWKRHQ